MLAGVGGHGPVRALGELTRDGGLDGGGEVPAVGVVGHSLSQTRGGGLQAREGEVETLSAQQGAGQGKGAGVAAFRQLLEGRAAGIGQAERLGDLVEGLARRVVDGGAQPAAGAHPGDLQQLAMAARDQQQQEGIGDVGGQPRGDRVALQVIDRHQRQAPRQGHSLAEGQPHHHPADQARAGGGGDARELAIAEAGGLERLGGDRVDGLHMGAGGDLWHHAAIGRVVGDLRSDDGGQHLHMAVGVQAHDRRGGLVAAGLQSKDGQRCGHSVAAFRPVL